MTDTPKPPDEIWACFGPPPGMFAVPDWRASVREPYGDSKLIKRYVPAARLKDAKEKGRRAGLEEAWEIAVQKTDANYSDEIVDELNDLILADIKTKQGPRS